MTPAHQVTPRLRPAAAALLAALCVLGALADPAAARTRGPDVAVKVLTPGVRGLFTGDTVRLRVSARTPSALVVALVAPEGRRLAALAPPARVRVGRGPRVLSFRVSAAGRRALLACAAVRAAVVQRPARGAARRGQYLLGACQDGRTLVSPIDPGQQQTLAFGDRSHWLQPWRAYLETVPARRLLDAAGMNFNVSAAEAPATARLLAASGVRRARVEIPWSDVNFDNPGVLDTQADLLTRLGALHDSGLRPLILLNGDEGRPVPTRKFDLDVTAPAHAGDRTVSLGTTNIDQVFPGLTGLDGARAAEFIITSVAADGTATLAKALPNDVPAGTYPAETLRYAPLGDPGSPGYEDTMAGWLAYAKTVTRLVSSVFGQSFDVEVWNELAHRSAFLNVDNYYDPPPSLNQELSQDNCEELVTRTVAFLRDPANGVDHIGIGDGCANTIPWPAGSTAPRGLTAIDKHPYQFFLHYAPGLLSAQRPLDALGSVNGTQDANSLWHEAFTPTYDAFFPEFSLSGVETETYVRDLSPVTTDVYGTQHGRSTHPAGGAPPVMWITEANLNLFSGPDAPGPGLSRPAIDHLHAKAALRYLASFVNKGVRAVYLFAAKSDDYGYVTPAFFQALAQSPGAYPGDAAGGEVTAVLRRFLGAFAHARSLSRTIPVSLTAITDRGNHAQFGGDGTAAHPPLYDRDVLGFFPFQVSSRRLVIPYYVMSRDLSRVYRPALPADDVSRYDLPPEEMVVRIAGIPRAARARVRGADSLTGRPVAVRVLARYRDVLVVRVPATDSPRLLTIDRR